MIKFKQLLGFSDYKASEDGIIYGKWALKQYKRGKDTPLYVELHQGGKKYNKAVRILVLEAFYGPQPSNTQPIHKNGNFQDNRLCNLEWGEDDKKRCCMCKQYKPLFRRHINRLTPYCESCYTSKYNIHRHVVKEVILSEAEKGYLAGFIDGEGCVSVAKGKHSRCKDKTFHTAKITIGNTNMKMLEIFEKVGVGYIYYRKSKKPRQKDAIIWCMCSNAVRAILPQIASYMVLKRPQARLVLEFLDLAKNVNNNGNDRQAYLKRADEIFQEMKVLNKKGK